MCSHYQRRRVAMGCNTSLVNAFECIWIVSSFWHLIWINTTAVKQAYSKRIQDLVLDSTSSNKITRQQIFIQNVKARQRIDLNNIKWFAGSICRVILQWQFQKSFSLILGKYVLKKWQKWAPSLSKLSHKSQKLLRSYPPR